MDDGSVLADQRFRRLGLRRMLTRRDSRAATTVAPGILGQFDDLGSEEKDVLFDTFMAWRANKGSADNAAAQLHVYPNTVRHRLRRIEANIDRSLAVPDELAELCLACEIRENMSAP
jgi:DNA-binding PucR family transcriptional regulator